MIVTAECSGEEDKVEKAAAETVATEQTVAEEIAAGKAIGRAAVHTMGRTPGSRVCYRPYARERSAR
jgi:hypothetical protein